MDLGECHCGVAGDGLRPSGRERHDVPQGQRRPSRLSREPSKADTSTKKRQALSGWSMRPARALGPAAKLDCPQRGAHRTTLHRPIAGYQQGVDCGSSEFGSKYNASSLYVTTATYMGWNTYNYVGVKEVLIPTGGYGAQWGNDALVCGNDVALLILKDPIPADEAKVLIPRVDDPLLPGETYSAVGYGATDQAGNGSGTARRDNLKTDWIGDAPNLPFYLQYSVKEAEWVGDTGVCQGDSGGPAVDQFERVIGVASRGGWL